MEPAKDSAQTPPMQLEESGFKRNFTAILLGSVFRGRKSEWDAEAQLFLSSLPGTR
jgi:hypothetical protein